MLRNTGIRDSSRSFLLEIPLFLVSLSVFSVGRQRPSAFEVLLGLYFGEYSYYELWTPRFIKGQRVHQERTALVHVCEIRKLHSRKKHNCDASGRNMSFVALILI